MDRVRARQLPEVARVPEAIEDHAAVKGICHLRGLESWSVGVNL
jgi:hypothetical protein